MSIHLYINSNLTKGVHMTDTSLGVQVDLEQVEKELETGAVELGVLRYRKKYAESKAAKGDMTLFTPEMKLLVRTMPTLSKAIVKMLATSRGKSAKLYRNAFLDMDKPEDQRVPIHADELAFITIRHLFNHTLGDTQLQRLCISLSEAVRIHKDDLRFQKHTDPGIRAYRAVVGKNIKSSHQGHRHKVLTHARHKMGIEDTKWTDVEKLHIGRVLIDLFLCHCKWNEDEDIFKHKFFRKPKKRGNGENSWARTVAPTERTKEWLKENHTMCALLTPVALPMVIEPEPWSEITIGGYRNPVLATHARYSMIRGIPDNLRPDLQKIITPEVYEGVNVIQETAYRINARILDAFEKYIGTGLAGLPDASKPEDRRPPKPWNGSEEFEAYKTNHPEDFRKWNIKASHAYDEYWREKSKRASVIEKLRIARKFSPFNRIWFPMSFDWRGRLYPMTTPALTPHGDDLAKALLEFADAKPLGKRGVYWLKVHGANCAGQDKISLDDRVKWVEDNEDMIREIGENPYGEAQEKYWTDETKVEHPFQFLAFCMDYAEYLKVGESYESRLVIGMDATCSGLQHWSALLKDAEGGKEVALLPTDKPTDIYSKVAEEVSGIIEQDDSDMAQIWKGKVTRKHTKQNTMTTPYGVKRPTMRDQVVKVLTDLDRKNGGQRYLGDVEVDNYEAAQYLAELNRQGIRRAVPKAIAGMEWIQNVARILGELKIPLQWVSPVGFPVIQTYWKTRTKRVNTYWGSVELDQDHCRAKEGRKKAEVKLNLSYPAPELGVQIPKAENGSAPNYVHSYDGTHLLFTAIGFRDKGYDCFAAVHDSFGCHACDVDALHETIREQFVMLYNDDNRLMELKKYVEEYSGVRLPDPPAQGDLDLNAVMDSPYFFA
jgi:DNA-directed RNA polymerase